MHQDGLVHISELANEFVSDPHKVVKPGQIVQVRVMQVDVERNRVNLSMRAEGAAPVKAQRPPRREQNNEQRSERKPQGKRPQPRKDQVERPQRSKQENHKSKNWWFWCIIIASRN